MQPAHQSLRSLLRKPTAFLTVALLFARASALGPAAFAEDWPGWRRDGSGVSPETHLPHTWSPTANVLWVAAIPGEGLSSPIVWQDRVFLTTAASEPEWQGANVVLLALFTVLALFVLLSYLTSPAAYPRPPTPRARLFLRGTLLMVTFVAAAYLVPMALDQLRARFPTLAIRLVGKPWQYSSEHSLHIRTDDFLAGFLAAFALLCSGPAFRGSPAPVSPPGSLRQPSTASAPLCWLQCGCIIAMVGTFLAEKTRLLAISLLVFVILSFLQLLAGRQQPATLAATPLPRLTGCHLLSCFRSYYVLGMAATFLMAVSTYVINSPLLPPLPTWYQTADICSLALIAAIGSFHPRSTARIRSILILVPILTLFALFPLHAHTREEWWDSLRDARFEVYGAILIVSCTGFTLEWFQARSTKGEESWPSIAAPRAAYGLVLAVLLFAAATLFFPPNAVLWRQVLCLDQKDGTLLWKTRCARGAMKPLYSRNSLATPTPVTDGHHVYAHFGDAGTYCLDYAGRVVWSHHEPVAPPPYGFASSPVLWGDLLMVTYDLTATSFTAALDAPTGHVRWKADRTHLIHPAEGESSERGLLEGYTTPMVLERAGRPQLVSHAGYYLSGYDLATGKELWHFQCPGDAIVVSPVSWEDLIIVGGARCFQAVQVKRENDRFTATALWRARRNFPDVPSPVVYGAHAYAVTNKGIATCLEVRTGKVCWTERLHGIFEASVAAGDGKLFFCDMDGVTTVVAAGPTFQLLSRNAVGESVRASFAIREGRIFIRGDRHLFCVGGNP